MWYLFNPLSVVNLIKLATEGSSTSMTVPVICKSTHHSNGSKSIHLQWPKIADIIPAIAHCCSKATGTGTSTSIIRTNPRCSSPVTFCDSSQKLQMVTVDHTNWNLIAINFSVEKSNKITDWEMVSALIQRSVLHMIIVKRSVSIMLLTLQSALQLGASLQKAVVTLHLLLGLFGQLPLLLQWGWAHSLRLGHRIRLGKLILVWGI